MASKEYRLLQEENVIPGVFPYPCDEDLNYSKRRQFLGGIGYLTLALSLSVNALFLILHFSSRPHDVSPNRTVFGSVTLEPCNVQFIDYYQHALSAISKWRGLTTAILLAITEPYGIKLGRH